MIRFLLIACLLFLGFSSKAQKKIIHQDLVWVRGNLNLKLNNDINITQEFEKRVYWFPWRGHQFLSRSLAHKKLSNNWSATAGIAFLRISAPNNPQIQILENQLEIYPMIGVDYTQPLSPKLTIKHRYWSEFRFVEVDEQYAFNNIRFRYLLMLQYGISDAIEAYILNEIFINAGKKIGPNVFDHNRFGVGVKCKINDNFFTDVVIFNWFQETAVPEQYYSRNIVRITISKSFSLAKNSY